MAMLLLAHGWARHMGVKLWVVTVDHGLRAEAAEEAAFVRAECEALGLNHTVLRWSWDGQGNLQARARQARLELIDRWRGLLTHVLMAHTEDDLAETFVMRLARGSGAEGLAAMDAKRRVKLGPGELLSERECDGPKPQQSEPGRGTMIRPGWMDVVRPLLGERREALRAHLRFYRTGWIEDPSNDDARFDRVAVRKARPQLEALGLDTGTLAATARRMARAREALYARAAEAAREVRTCRDTGDVIFGRAHLARLDEETALRLLAEGLRYVSSEPLRPRMSALEDVLDRAVSGGGMTLQGCRITTDPDTLRMTREYAAVAGHEVPVGAGHWDRRWRLFQRELEGLTMRALGEAGAAQLDERPGGIPYATLIAMPAVFDGKSLRAFAPAAIGPKLRPNLEPPGGAFAAGWAPLKRRN